MATLPSVALLNAILNGNPVVSTVRILNTETLRDGPDNKASRLDIEAETNDGTIVNVAILDSEATAEPMR